MQKQMELENFALPEVKVRLKLVEGEQRYSNEVIDSPNAAVEVMRDLLKEMDREYVCVVNLDAQLRPINYNIVAVGGINEVHYRTADIFKSTILSNAYGIMFFHNHPSGIPNPSDADKKATEDIINAANTLNIPVLDHIIIGEKKVFSFRINYPEMFQQEVSRKVEMPRAARKRAEEGLYYIKVRFKEKIAFSQEEADLYRDIFLRYAGNSTTKVRVLEMKDKEMHAILQEGAEENISQLMRRVNVSYSYWYKALHPEVTRGESIFIDRFQSHILKTEKEMQEVIEQLIDLPGLDKRKVEEDLEL